MTTFESEQLDIEEAEKRLKVCPYCKTAEIKCGTYGWSADECTGYEVICSCDHYKPYTNYCDTPSSAAEQWNRLIKAERPETNAEYYSKHFKEFIELTKDMVKSENSCVKCPCRDKCTKNPETDCDKSWGNWMNGKFKR